MMASGRKAGLFRTYDYHNGTRLRSGDGQMTRSRQCYDACSVVCSEHAFEFRHVRLCPKWIVIMRTMSVMQSAPRLRMVPGCWAPQHESLELLPLTSYVPTAHRLVRCRACTWEVVSVMRSAPKLPPWLSTWPFTSTRMPCGAEVKSHKGQPIWLRRQAVHDAT